MGQQGAVAAVMVPGVRTILPLRALALCLCLVASAAGAQPEVGELQLKAAYLYRFASFVQWPERAFATSDSPFLIGVAGDDELADEARQVVAGRGIDGHPFEVRRVQRGDSLDDLHILFLGALDRSALAELLNSARSLALLTVSDSPHAVELGSMIRFVAARERLRFEVALAQVEPAGLRISARMLATAANVTGTP
ncbi:YfiR family protein [Massilia horti]|uniref:YfiR family protein n=1 Tax=Massilia horti TaxID=2562153 RepID=A0A4Y9T526_9BURK|nr:YfiR family protein [Massilia horti]TFW35761.1 YfiR family protein [Massilia horti]